jgi:hypothetical protein
MLIDKALKGLRPVAACGNLTTARTGWSLAGPPNTGKQSRPSPGGGRGNYQDDL